MNVVVVISSLTIGCEPVVSEELTFGTNALS